MQRETVVSFVRHGQVHNPEGVYYGRLPSFGLSEAGREQARAVARALRDRQAAAIFTSPLLRAVQTAAILRAGLAGTPLYRSKWLTEVHSPFDGRPTSELAARHWDLYTGSPPEFEQPNDVLRRARCFLSRIRGRYAGKHLVAVTHGDLIAFLILWSKSAPTTPEHGRDLTRWGFPVSYPMPGSILELRFGTPDSDELPSMDYWAGP